MKNRHLYILVVQPPCFDRLVYELFFVYRKGLSSSKRNRHFLYWWCTSRVVWYLHGGEMKCWMGIVQWSTFSSCTYTVDGSELQPSPVDMENITIFTGFYTCEVVHDFFHQSGPGGPWRSNTSAVKSNRETSPVGSMGSANKHNQLYSSTMEPQTTS